MRYAGQEPDLEDVLSDPIVRILMQRDAVAEPSLRRVIDDVRRRLRYGLGTTDEFRIAIPVYTPRLNRILYSGIPSR